MSKVIKNPYGYLIFRNSKRSYARWKMSKYIGRKLKYRETVHHKNGNKLDNSRRNLAIVSQRQNNRLSNVSMKDIKTYQRLKQKRRK